MGTRSNNALIIMADHLSSITSEAQRYLKSVANIVTDQGAVGWTWETNISPFHARHSVLDIKEEVAILEWVLSLPKSGFKMYRVGSDGGAKGEWDNHPLQAHPLIAGVIADFQQQEIENKPPAVDLSQAITQMVDISTGHIPKHTADALGEESVKPESAELYDVLSYVHYHEYGWIIHCSNEEHIEGKHPELANLIRLARANGAQHLKLDCDGIKIAGLPSFEW